MIMHKDLNRLINVIAETDNESQVYPLLDARERMIKYKNGKRLSRLRRLAFQHICLTYT